MAWSAPSEQKILDQFTPNEAATIAAVQGATDNLPELLAGVVAEIRDAIRSGNYPLDADATTLPLGLHNLAVDLARWRYLIAMPRLSALQTDARKQAAERAEAKLDKIAASQWSVEPPDPDSATQHTGNWNSSPRLVGRMEPLPTPAQQFPGGGTGANPNAPADL